MKLDSRFDAKRIAILTALTLLPVTAFAAAAATGVDGGFSGSLCEAFASMFSCSGGCPHP